MPNANDSIRDCWLRSSDAEENELLTPWDTALLGYFIDDEPAVNEHWTDDLREWISGHEEVVFFLEERTFHICRAHRDARRVIETGIIPAGFTCPLGRADCPFSGRTRAVLLCPRSGRIS